MSTINIEAWIRMYEEQAQQARHHETLRSNSTNVILVLSGAILAFLGTDVAGVTSLHQVLLGFLLVLINLYGAILSRKHYERNRLHTRIAGTYRNVISMSTALGGNFLDNKNDSARNCHKQKYKIFSQVEANLLWIGLHLVTALLGAILVICPFPELWSKVVCG